ncbi:MAG TPA: DUF885 family protein [Rhizomicrobium sp.]|nr:DUF885 family protein [Rhizomicrobium sp.]
MLDRRTALKSGAAAFAIAAAAPAFKAEAADAKLNALFDQFVQEDLDLSPTSATSYGLDTGKRAHQRGEIDDASLAGIAKAKALNASQRQRLGQIGRSRLTGADQLNYDIVMYGLTTADDAGKEFDYGGAGAGAPYILSQLTGSYCQIPSFLDSQHPVETKTDADAYLARLEGFAVAMDQEVEVTRHDMAEKVVAPDFALAKTLLQMNQLRAENAASSNLVMSLVNRAKAKKIAGDFATPGAKIVAEKVYPALDRQIALVKELQKNTRHDAGVWALPKGAEYYRASLAQWATTDKTPEEIHRLGLEVVADHTAKLDALMKKQGMTTGTVGERLRAMYKDPRYLYPNTDAAKEKLIADLNARVQKVRADLPKYFGALPKANLEIRRVPKNIEAAQPGGYYNNASLDGKRPGIYWINLRDTAEVPKWTLGTLTYHEGIPGHHLQLSIQQEANLPLIRKLSFFSAYIEGWALYSEQLAVEMGEYGDDTLGQIGQLHDSMFRGVRLVVDSGMHAMKWSREQAVKYYVDTLGDLEASAITEIERYCVWPGQACTYMLGKLAILEARARAQKELGAKFDIRKFHDAILLNGAMPLKLIDSVVDKYIGSAKA